MSFGFSVGDAVTLGQLAWKTIQNSLKACGEHDELTREASSLHVVIRRLEKEVSKPESPINRPEDKCKEELQSIVDGCEKVLKVLNRVLEKYNTLSEKERSAKKLWRRVRFGNGEMADTRDLREKLIYYTSALSLFVNMVSMGSIGRVESQMEAAGGDIREIRIAVNGITAHLLAATHREGSVLTTYGDDDKAVWKEFRKELIEEGFSSATIRKHKQLIKAYIKELGDRGLLDDEDPHDIEELSGLADIDLDDHATPPTKPSNLHKATPMAPSMTGQEFLARDEISSTEKKIEPGRNVFDHGSPIDTVPTCNPKKVSVLDEGHDFSPFGIKIAHYKPVEVQAYEAPVHSGYCIIVSDPYPKYSWSMVLEGFQRRLQVLVECFPLLWIFRARRDMDQVHIYVVHDIRIQWDLRELRHLMISARKILEKVESYFDLSPGSASILKACLPFNHRQAYSSQWLELEEYLFSEWQFPRYLSHHFDEEAFDNIIAIIDGEIKPWNRYFDDGFREYAERLPKTWAKAAQVITSNDYDGITSLALYVNLPSTAPAQDQEETENRPPAMSPSSASSSTTPHPPISDDYEDSEIRLEDINRKALSSIWQDIYISTFLPQCNDFILNTPSNKRLNFEHKRLSEHILTLVILPLDAVDLKGSLALRQERKSMVDKAQAKLSELDKAKAEKMRSYVV